MPISARHAALVANHLDAGAPSPTSCSEAEQRAREEALEGELRDLERAQRELVLEAEAARRAAEYAA